MVKKFSELVSEPINKEKLNLIQGGFMQSGFQLNLDVDTPACTTFACSTDVFNSSPFCTQGDAICGSKMSWCKVALEWYVIL